MGDLPPSYEAATGIPVDQSCTDVVPPNPSAPLQGQIIATPNTTIIPIPPQTTFPTQNHQQLPYPVNSSYPTSLPTAQTNVILRRRPNKGNSKCFRLTITIIAIVVTVIIIALYVAYQIKRHKEFNDKFESVYGQSDYPKYNWDTFNIRNDPQPEYPKFDWDGFNKNNQELLDRFNTKISQSYEIPKFDYN